MLKNDQFQNKQNAYNFPTDTPPQESSQLRRSNRQAIKLLAQKKVKIMQTKSDNNHQRKSIADKKLKSLRLIRHEEESSMKDFDDYQISPKVHKQQQTIQNHNNQCLRDEQNVQKQISIVSNLRESQTYRQKSKSRARQLVKNMISNSSKNLNTQDQIQKKIENQKRLLPHQISLNKQTIQNASQRSSQYSPERRCVEYGIDVKPLQKSCSSNGFHRVKKQKCSTLQLTKESSLSRNSSLSRKYISSKPAVQPVFDSMSNKQQKNHDYDLVIHQKPKKIAQNGKTSSKFVAKQSGLRKEQSSKRFSKHSNSKGSNAQVIQQQQQAQTIQQINPLVRQGKHLFTECGINQEASTKKSISTGIRQGGKSQKQIGQETENVSRQVSKQMLISRRQTQKLISRARQKNKKIIGKLKQKRSAIRQSLNNNISRFSSSFAAFRASSQMQQKSKLHNQLAHNNESKLNHLFQHQQPQRQNSQQQSYELQGQQMLSLSSNINSQSVINFNSQIKQKIQLHVQTLTIIADYCQSFNNIYQDCDEWEELIFLLYKKYYIQRQKVYKLLKQGKIIWDDRYEVQQLPFVFPFSEMDGSQLAVFRESKEAMYLELDMQTDNSTIKCALRDLYNQCIQKTAENSHINMYEVDNFAEDIVQDLNEEINMLMESCGKSQKIKNRINQAIQVGLIVAHIEGYYFEDIEEIIMGDLASKDFFQEYYPKFMEIFDDDE